MKEFIVKALDVNATTIIPNLGAFMRMGKSVLFNEFLKYDDGKLANFIAEQKSIEVAQAKEEVSQFSKSLTSDFETGKSVFFEGIGELKKEDGKLKLEPITSSETIVNPEVKKEEVLPEVVAPPKIEEFKPKPEPEIKKTEVEKPKEVDTPKKVVVNKPIATDFGAQDAIDKIKGFINKSDLIDFTRGENRKTVIDALNKKLDALNGKTESTKEVKTDAPVEVKTEKPLEEIKPLNEVKKEEEQSVEKPIEKKEEPKVVVPVVETPIANEIEKPEVKNEISKPQEEIKKTPKKEEEIDTTDTETIITPPSSAKDKKDKKPLDEKEIIAISKSVDETEKQLKKRKRRRIVLWLSLIFILGGGGTLGYLKKDMILAYFEKEHTPKELASNESEDSEDETNNETQEDKNIEPIVVEEVKEEIVEEPIEEVVKEVKKEPVVKQVNEVPEKKVTSSGQSSFGKYHIVSGSYSSEENANNKVQELQSKGYKEAKILGLVNGLHTVRAMSFDDLESAKSALKDFKDAGNKGFVKKI
jgi:nucleoid DNA-binding protein